MNHWIVTFLNEHPVAAFFIAWPVGLTLVSICWQVAAILENGMNLVMHLVNQAANAFVIAVRGYMPAPPADEPEDDKPAS